MRTFDLIVIGWGKGGKTLAAEAAARGETVAMVEQSSRMYGGTCINVGCIPSKSLVTSAAQAKTMAFGSFGERARFYAGAIAEKRRLVTMLRRKMYEKLHDFKNVEIFNGVGSFTAAREVQVTGASLRETISGRRIVIDTGSQAVLPAIDGMQPNPPVYTSETLLELERLPEHLIIVGGGYIGVEFASIYANFGSRVTLVQHGPRFLPKEDEEVAGAIAEVLTAAGVTIQTGCEPTALASEAGNAVLTARDAGGRNRQWSGDAVLVAAGRRPNTAALQPEAAGLAVTPRGAIAVDEYLRSNIPGVWAIGDVTGGPQFTYVSFDDHRIVRAQLFGLEASRTASGRNIPYSVFLSPPFSRVGLNEREARQQGYEIKIGRIPAAAIPKAQVLRETDGLLKAVIDARTDRILGAMLFCAESHELINLIKLAMDAGLPYAVLRDQIYTHPTMAESLNDLFGAIH